MSTLVEQQEVCLKFSADYEALELDLMVGISKNFLSGALPLNSCDIFRRVNLAGGFCGLAKSFLRRQISLRRGMLII